MQTFVFTRTMQYTETIEVPANNYEDALELALIEDGTRNNNDIVVHIGLKKVKDSP